MTGDVGNLGVRAGEPSKIYSGKPDLEPNSVGSGTNKFISNIDFFLKRGLALTLPKTWIQHHKNSKNF